MYEFKREFEFTSYLSVRRNFAMWTDFHFALYSLEVDTIKNFLRTETLQNVAH